MDSGHFETIPRPFPLHHSLRAIMDQIDIQADSRHVTLKRDLDARIDQIPGSFKSEEGLWVVGSELRLHQILTNLAANAVKYTPDGGGFVKISTQYLGVTFENELPGDPPEADENEEVPAYTPTPTEYLTFRLEVQDSGPGSES